jgi:hypothetical protein
MATRKKKSEVTIDASGSDVVKIVKGTHLTVTTFPNGKTKLEAYNKKYADLGLGQSIKSINSIKKTSVLLLTKTFLDKYLDQLIDVVEHKISYIEKILDGGDEMSKSSFKYLKYKIEYLVNKKIY